MSNIECAGSTCAARNICFALEANGVLTNVDSACAVPQMLAQQGGVINRDKVDFKPVMSRGSKATPLIAELGNAAFANLNRGVPAEREALIDLHHDVLEAQFSLWQAMLNAPRQNGRQFTHQELTAYNENIAAKQKARGKLQISGSEAVLALAGFDSQCLDTYNILFDDDMTHTIDRVVGNMMDGQPTLLVGDKGIAKTSVAKLASRLSYDAEPLVISGHGDMGTNELMGETGLKDGKTYFKEGRIPQAAREGRPIIIDEVDVADVAVMLRLQDILLNIKPGKELVLQENGQEAIIVQPGFAIIATANEASRRFKHRQEADPANRDRYDIIRLSYPDLGDGTNGDILRRNMTNLRRLAYAAVSDHKGTITGVRGDQVEQIVVLAGATQTLYSQPATSAMRQAIGQTRVTGSILENESLMTDCITPRRMYTDLSRLAANNKNSYTFEDVLEAMLQRLDEGDQTENSKIARYLLNEISKIAA